MKTRTEFIDNKEILIVDGAVSAENLYKYYTFACGSLYSISRVGSDTPESLQHRKTLQSNYLLRDILNPNFDFFRNEFILNYAKQKQLRLYEFYVNLCTAGDIYPYHVDGYNNNDKTLLYYMNSEWHPYWEGETHFTDNSLTDVLVSCGFIPGRMVLFNSTIPHKSSQPSSDGKYYRFVFTAKFVDESNELKYNSSLNIEDFIYEKYDLSKLTDREKAVVNFISLHTKNIEHSGDTLFNHFYNTFSILKHLNRTEDVCIAGMLHSIYGTDYFNPEILVKSEQIEKMVGQYSENLISIFCSPNRDDLIKNNSLNLPKNVQLDLLYILYANLIEQSKRIVISQNEFANIKNKINNLSI